MVLCPASPQLYNKTPGMCVSMCVSVCVSVGVCTCVCVCVCVSVIVTREAEDFYLERFLRSFLFSAKSGQHYTHTHTHTHIYTDTDTDTHKRIFFPTD